MSISSHRKYMVAAAAWSPDAKEFAVGVLDQVCNTLPVFGSNRTLQKLHRLSSVSDQHADSERRTTGTFIHRLSIDQSLDLMQPDYSEPNTAVSPKLGFQAVPKTHEYFQALRGLASDTSTTVLLIGQGAAVELFGTFEMPHANAWDAINDLVITFVYRINLGFTGTYDFTVEIGTVSPIGSQDPNDFTPLTGGSFNMAGDLAVDGDGVYVSQEISILNADLPANPHTARYAWRITHDTPLASSTDEFYDPDAVFSDATGMVPEWADQDGSKDPDDIVAAIEGEVGGIFDPDEADYAQSRMVWSTEAAAARLHFQCDLPTFFNLQNHKWSLRYGLLRIDQFIELSMWQGLPGSPGSFQIQTWGDNIATIGAAAGNYAPFTFAATDVNPALLELIQDWSNVWFRLQVNQPVTASTTTTVLSPDYGPGKQHGATPPWAITGTSDLSDSSDLTFITSPVNASPGSPFQFHAFHRSTMEELTFPKEAITSVKVIARVRYIGAGRTNLSLGLENVSTGLGWFSNIQGLDFANIPGGGFLDLEFDLSAQGIATIMDWKNFRSVVVVWKDSVGQIDLSKISVEVITGVGSAARIFGFSYIGPGLGDEVVGAPIDISYMRADGPAAVAAAAGDKLRAYIGTVEDPQSATQVGKIYELDSPDFQTWTDVSDVGGYDSNQRDKSWHFASYGEIVIATNYSDPVQRKGLSDNAFSPLIGFDTAGVAIPNYATTEQGVVPRARFVATINAFLCLANCDPTSVPGVAQAYTFWCSRFSQPQYFATQKLEWQSGAFQLVSTAGELTGLVGGEYGVAFKENSIMRVEYVQLPEVFDFPFISRNQGTLFPRSIVVVEDDIYFIGIGGVYRIRAGQVVEPLLEGNNVRKFMFDSAFEEFAITSLISSLESENSARVIGGYESVTGCVFWAIHSEANDAEWFMCDSVIVFSPVEGRFSLLRGDMTGDVNEILASGRMPRAASFFPENNLKIGGFLTLGNRAVSAETYLLKTLLVINDIPPQISTWGENRTYEFFFRSNTVPASQFPGVALGQEVVIHGVRPLLVLERDKILPPYNVYIEANQSQLMDDGNGVVAVLFSAAAREDGRLDVGDPISGEFFKFALALGESEEPIVKEFHGWMVWYEPAGDH